MKQGSFLEITVPNPHKSSDRKSGNTNVFLPHGKKIVIMSNLFAPDHDRALFAEVLQWLSQYKPHLIVLLGRIVHDHAFQLLAPGASTREADEDEPDLAPELQQAKDHSEIWEERVIFAGKRIGEEIFLRMLEAAGPESQILYVPALEGSNQNLPPEGNIKSVLERVQRRVDGWREAHKIDSSDFPIIAIKRREFDKLLGIADHARVKVLPFGSTITLHCQTGLQLPGDTPDVIKRKGKVLTKVRLEVGKRKIMNPIAEAYNAAMLNVMPTILGFPPNLANGWWTKYFNVNQDNRLYMFFSQIGMLFARERLDFGDTAIDRYASGFYCGHNWRGCLHGKSFPFIRGDDGRRSASLWGHVIEEREPGDLGRQDVIHID